LNTGRNAYAGQTFSLAFQHQIAKKTPSALIQQPSINMQGVFLSNASSMNVQGVILFKMQNTLQYLNE
jgi:hypothetical protein